ncbi:ABC transporter ATP-binding protein [Limibaculum sp. M0105]|uniref:ABC transporter ATP-binding protein n=1 Tax=Thermohalobaculum xanthum TaxID=2753746 RepID=A0A8J7M768_9RHOB|nr:ABC transporter ATP-binding protein [Thermohalobaculum xanthum]MBK0399614.1 ABC transporter ATP-binding protein [Thermohalobaculum xanthum]
MLKVEGLDAFYGKVQVLHGLSLEVDRGEILCLLGRNGAGKTTALKAIMGLVPPRAGAVMLDGVDISLLPPEDIAKEGIGYVPQGRRLFAELTVAENLEIGLMVRGAPRRARGRVLERVLDLFPVLAERLHQRSGTLSGGEQQMLAIGRALCLEPAVLMLDEPTEGLMPAMIQRIREVVLAMRAEGVAVLLVEQRVEAVLPVADRVLFVENGRSRDCVAASDLGEDHALLHRYVGVGA